MEGEREGAREREREGGREREGWREGPPTKYPKYYPQSLNGGITILTILSIFNDYSVCPYD